MRKHGISAELFSSGTLTSNALIVLKLLKQVSCTVPRDWMFQVSLGAGDGSEAESSAVLREDPGLALSIHVAAHSSL